MMDVSGFGDFISQVGFPIFAFCLMVYQSDKQTSRWQSAIDSMTEAFNSLTAAINKVLKTVEGGDDE